MNELFSKQCTALDSGSSLPPFFLVTEEVLSEVTFDENDICRAIKNLKPNKAHDQNDISIHMVHFLTKVLSNQHLYL